ncbi:protein HTATIP2-like [Babylonia areolata]|uniref:protein HTATIP2-like n=1 Tax=Babylonia areolata TaxID=304850 RepID=UPI003FD149E1
MQFLWFKCDEIIGGSAIAVAVIAVCLGGFFLHHELAHEPGTERHCMMASETGVNLERFKGEDHTAFVLGYTGESGRMLLQDLKELKVFSKVLLIGRREVSLDPSFGPEFEQKVVDFENLDASRHVFKGADVGFCCLGTTKAKSGASGFVRVDHDYVLSAASIAKDEGCHHFSVISTMSANKNSSMLYTRTKGQMEEALKVLHFDRLSIYRPAVIMCNREEHRPGEAFARVLLKPVSYLFPTAITTPVEVLSRAMVNNAMAPKDIPVEVYENKAIHQLSGISPACKNKAPQKKGAEPGAGGEAGPTEKESSGKEAK